jgi:AcrR family transcriptional regulator
MAAANKRERLVESASYLFYAHGSSNTSLADIAKHAAIPIGNVYYYFKTKEELALAVILKRKEQFAAIYHALNDNIDDPRQRLSEVLRYFDTLKADYAKFGCPVAKIIADGDVEKDTIAKTAAQIFSDFIAWAHIHFTQLGHAQDAKRLAISLMAGIQGAAIMAKATADPQTMSDELARLTAWIETIPNKKIQLGKVGIK